MLTTIIRGAGDKPASDIIDPLCTTQAVAVERGRNFLDDQYNLRIVRGELVFESLVIPGVLVHVVDDLFDDVWRGKVSSVSIAIGRQGLTQSLSIDRPVR